MRRRLFVAVVFLVSVTLLTGCNQGKKEAEAPVTLTAYSQLANYSGEMTGWFAQILLERFNVKIIIVPDADGVYETRMESGNLGDIVIWGGDGDQYLGAVEAGLLFDWNEDNLLDEYGPYIKEHMPHALEKNKEISGGTLYGFGHNVAFSSEDHEAFFYTWDLRWDLYKRLGYPAVKDLDDYLQLMIDMKAIEPVDEAGNPTYAVSLWPDWDGDMVMYVKAFATAYYGYDELGIGLYDPETGEFHGALDEDGPYLEALRFFNALYRHDLLDPDSMTNTFDKAMEKVKNGGTFFSIFNFAGSDGYNTMDHQNEGKMMLTMTPEEATPIVYGMNVKGGNRIWSIGAKTQYPELCMEIINWLATPEGRMTSEYGPKGITWDYDQNGKSYFTDLGKQMRYDKSVAFPAESGYSGKFSDGEFELNNTTWSIDAINPESGEPFNWEFWESNQGEPRSAIEADWRAFTGTNHADEYLNNRKYKVAIGTSYSIGTRSYELRVKWEQVTKAIKDYSWRAIYSDSEARFNAQVRLMQRDVRSYGYEECLEWTLQEAARRKALEDEVRSAL